MYTRIFKLCILIVAISGCKSNGNDSDNIYLLPLGKVPYTISTLEKGTPLKLIALAGKQMQSDNDHIYYIQFLTINENTRDTIRVLTPLISVGQENIYTTPTLYNHDKGIEVAAFEPIDSSFNLKLNMAAINDPKEFENGSINKMTEKIMIPEMAVMVKGVVLFDNNRFKTVIGSLHFTEQPW